MLIEISGNQYELQKFANAVQEPIERCEKRAKWSVASSDRVR